MNPRTADDPELQAALRAWDSAIASRENSFDESMQIRTALRDSASRQADGWAALTSGRISAFRGDVDFAEVLLTEALGRFYLIGDAYGEAMAISHFSIPQTSHQDLDRALEFALKPLSTSIPFLDQDRILLHNCAAQCYWSREESHHAIAHLLKSLELARSINDSERSSVALGNIGAVLMSLGEWDLALAVSLKAWKLQLINSTDREKHQPTQLANVVLLNCLLGNHRKALGYADQLFEYAIASREPAALLYFFPLVDAYSLNGQSVKAADCLARAHALSQTNKTAFASAHLMVADAMLLEAQSNHRSAIVLAEQVLAQPVEVVKRAAHLCAALLLTRSNAALGRKAESMKWKEWANHLRYENPLGSLLAIQIRANLSVEPLVEPLTDKELACLSLSAHGHTSADIALKLGIKTRTVNFHFANVLRKLNAVNRLEAIAKAVSAKLLRTH